MKMKNEEPPMSRPEFRSKEVPDKTKFATETVTGVDSEEFRDMLIRDSVKTYASGMTHVSE